MRTILTAENSEILSQHRQTVATLGLECAAADCVLFQDLEDRVQTSPSPELVLVFEGDKESTLTAVHHAGNIGGCVLAVTPPGQRLHEPLRHAGALECIRLDNLRAELSAALERLNREGRLRNRMGRCVAVVAASGGTGVTTIASNLAFALEASHRGQVLLAEFGNTTPSLAFSLDLDVVHGVDELFQGWQRSDRHMLQQAMVEHAAGLRVIAHTATAVAPAAPPVHGLAQLLGLCRAMNERVVVDLGCSIYPALPEGLRMASAALIVLRPDVPSLRQTARYVGALKDSGMRSDHLYLVLNRTGYRNELDRTEVESVIGLQVLELVPDEPGTVVAAVNEGKPLSQHSPRAKVTRSFERLARQLGPIIAD
jgi:pilus assembly protein CpaE